MPMNETVAKMVGRFERMERIDQYAFYQHIKSHCIETTALFELVTPNFDAMKRFFENLGMEVKADDGDQLLHLFGDGRVVSVRRGDVIFHLRESTGSSAVPAFNLWLTGYSDQEVEGLRHIGYEFQELTGPNGSIFRFTTPDGGAVLI